MRILVIGASGATGKQLIQKLKAAGHDVTAFIRDPGHFHQTGIKIAQGEARDLASLERAVKGQDAVVSAFGPRSLKKDDIQEVFMKNLVTAMTKAGVKRLVNLSAMGAGDSKEEMPLIARAVLVPLFLGRVYKDKERGESYLFQSSLDYVNVRPGRLTNAPAQGGVKASMHRDGLKASMSREDLAQFMTDQLTRSDWVRRSPLIGY